MSEKRGRGQPKFEPTPDQRSRVKLMKALGIPEDQICKTITNPRSGKPVAPMTLARAFAAELASGADCRHAALVALRHCAAASDRKIRSVDRETRWRWRLKVLWTAACTLRKRCADAADLKRCILRSRRRTT